MKITTKVHGYRQLKANAAQLTDQIGRGAMRDALTKAARLMVVAAKAKAPTGATGLLKQSLRQKVVTNPKKQLVTAFVGPSRNTRGQVDRFGNGNIETVRPVRYAHLVEFGTAARGVYGEKGLTVSPGNPPQPFMRPAYEATKRAAHAKYKTELGPAIQRAAAKIRKRKIRI